MEQQLQGRSDADAAPAGEVPALLPISDRVLLWGGLALLLAIRIVALRLNATDLFFDEAQYWTWSVEPAFGYYSKPPLIAWVISAATSVCGADEFCIRLPAPLFHTATALLVYAIGKRLYGGTVAVWAALGFAMLPGVSLSSSIISTDVPLLFFWAVALWGLVELTRSPAWWPVPVTALGFGLGLNAKYAMVFFPLSIAVGAVWSVELRRMLWDKRLYAGLALGALLIVPNLAWNLSHGFATFAHTADNAKWGGSLLHPGKAAEFLAGQLGVFGPILFPVLLGAAWAAWKRRTIEQDRLLLGMSLPVLGLITIQAVLSRAHANWAAPTYVAATVVVTAALLRVGARRWLVASFALHAAVLVVIAVGMWQAGSIRLPLVGDPFARMLGWREVAGVAGTELERARQSGKPYASVITDDRAVTAELLYYLRRETTPVLAWRNDNRPHDHYELTRPFVGGCEPVLLVSLRRDPARITQRFTRAEPLGMREVPAGAGERRDVWLFALSGYKAE